MVEKIIYLATLEYVHWLASILLLILVAPLERLFPRVKPKNIKPKLLTVLGIAFCAYLSLYAFKNSFHQDIISILFGVQIVSIAKLPINEWLIFIIGFLFMDFLIYLFHFLSHKITFLWSMHSVHHADEHVTASSALLHHPIETILSFIFVISFAVLFGVPVLVLIAYAAIGTIHNLLVHSNIAISSKVDAALRLVIVTPDMHRTHHSIDISEGNSNFGQLLTIWDRIFRTYKAHPSRSESKLKMGLPKSEKPNQFNTIGLLLHPFDRLFAKRN